MHGYFLVHYANLKWNWHNPLKNEWNVKWNKVRFAVVCAMNRTFKEYLDKFMKIFLGDSIVYNDMDNHLPKLNLCFDKCKE
jgi:hypothetical protein